MTDGSNNTRFAESLDDQLDHAAEELITGDSDDPPLSEEAVGGDADGLTCPEARICELTMGAPGS